MDNFTTSLLSSFTIRPYQHYYGNVEFNHALAIVFPVIDDYIIIPTIYTKDARRIKERINTDKRKGIINRTITYPLPFVRNADERKTFKGICNNYFFNNKIMYKIKVQEEYYYMTRGCIFDNNFNLLLCLALKVSLKTSTSDKVAFAPICYINKTVFNENNLINKGIINYIIKSFTNNTIINGNVDYAVAKDYTDIIIKDLSDIMIKPMLPVTYDLNTINNYLKTNVNLLSSTSNYIC